MPARTGVVLGLKGGYICEVTAVEIIQEIKHLPPEESNVTELSRAVHAVKKIKDFLK